MVISMPLAIGVTVPRMGNPRSLTAEENERVVAAVRKLLQRHKNNQTALAPKLGIAQPTLSGLLLGKHQAGYPLARRVAELSRIDLDVLLTGETRIEYEAPPGLPATALGNHHQWGEARADAEARYGARVDPEGLDRVAEITFSKPPKFLTAEIVKRLYDILLDAEAQTGTGPEPKGAKK
jgi:transcriptional regulator with XRE-family HTH domain